MSHISVIWSKRRASCDVYPITLITMITYNVITPYHPSDFTLTHPFLTSQKLVVIRGSCQLRKKTRIYYTQQTPISYFFLNLYKIRAGAWPTHPLPSFPLIFFIFFNLTNTLSSVLDRCDVTMVTICMSCHQGALIDHFQLNICILIRRPT